ncbi:MAG TPA: ABC transporter permease [Pontiella sp.]|nr:ABC transporter permease [Pontiella sp.]
MIILGGGSLVFNFQWHQLDKVAILVVCYSFFSAGLMGFIAALAGKERRADLLNTMLVIGMSLLGGCMWPVENLPEVFRDHVAQYLPTYWFSSAVRGLQSDYAGMDWMLSSSLSIGLGVLFIAAASSLFRFRLEKGIRE